MLPAPEEMGTSAALHQQCEEWTRKAGSTVVSDLAGTFDEVDDY